MFFDQILARQLHGLDLIIVLIERRPAVLARLSMEQQASSVNEIAPREGREIYPSRHSETSLDLMSVVIGTPRGGVDQSLPYLLKESPKSQSAAHQTPSNVDLVKEVNQESHVGPAAEWFAFGVGYYTKGMAKKYLVRAAGEDIPILRNRGLGVAVAVGTAAFFSWELCDWLENKRKASLYESHLLNTPDRTGGDFMAKPPDEPQNSFPGVRDIGNYLYSHTINQSGIPEYRQLMENKVLAHKDLTNQDFVQWAQKETNIPWSTQVEWGGALAGTGLVTGLYTAYKLAGAGLLSSVAKPWVVLAFTGIGFTASRLKTLADKYSGLSELYQARVLSEPVALAPAEKMQ